MTLTRLIAADEDSAYIEEEMRLEADGVMSRDELTAFYMEGGSLDFMDELEYKAEEDE